MRGLGDGRIPSARAGTRTDLRGLAWPAVVVAVFAGALALTAGFGGAFRGKHPTSGSGQAAPSAPATQESVGAPASARDCNRNTFIATLQRRVFVRRKPSRSSKAFAVLRRRTTLGTPEVSLVLGEVRGSAGGTWYRIELPMLPQRTSGFVPSNAIALAETPYRLGLDRKRFRLTLYSGCNKVKQYQVGLGTGATRAPPGRFYLTALLHLPEPDRLYGAYAYSLSGYTDTLAEWEARRIVGIHGTLDPSLIGRDDARGSVAIREADIEQLVKLLPLGTPIEIS